MPREIITLQVGQCGNQSECVEEKNVLQIVHVRASLLHWQGGSISRPPWYRSAFLPDVAGDTLSLFAVRGLALFFFICSYESMALVCWCLVMLHGSCLHTHVACSWH